MRPSNRPFGVSNGDVTMVDSSAKSGAINSTRSRAYEPKRSPNLLAGMPFGRRVEPAENPVVE
jgi:hypothetical protein